MSKIGCGVSTHELLTSPLMLHRARPRVLSVVRVFYSVPLVTPAIRADREAVPHVLQHRGEGFRTKVMKACESGGYSSIGAKLELD